MAKHTVCHIEFNVTDMERAQRFYGGLFDWTFRPFGPEMTVFGAGEQHIGGLMKSTAVEAGKSPSVWFEVEAIEPYLDKAPKVGGSVRDGKSEVPGVGWSACIQDPDGNPVGLVQFADKG